MSHQTSLPNEEARIAALVRATGVDAPPPDVAVLARLREQLDRGIGFQPVREEADEATIEKNRSGQAGSLSYDERRPMLSLMMRAFMALAAVVLIGVFAFNPFTATTVSGAPFSQVLKNLRQADTLRLEVVRGDRQAQVWIQRPGLVRFEESPKKYEIAAGSRWWQVDETTNSVSTGDSPWFRSSEQQVDLLELLAVDVKDADPLMRSRPTEKVTYDDNLCYVYRTTLQSKTGPVEIEAFANAATGQLAGIVARKPGVGAFKGPLAELRLLAVNEIVDESKFVVAKTLTEDGRIGKLSDAQGIVVLRPMLAKRWTPICRDTLLKPGDWLRTELRGANAVKATLSSDVEITLGPGSLLECISPTEARLHNGIAQINLPKKDSPAFTLLAPRAGSEKFAEGKQIVRVDREEKLVKLDQQPLWLKGFEGTANNESLGSLIVNLPDARDPVPLSIGYHKVSVEIRDQIARTTIEESFVNHTNARLEGVFHFPLPQDASISGFGMWIGNDLVEADIVEKQRAREIYETILRERRDPGLLEWTSGNLFKARVFPIEANSEKRIKIVYTQVLPLRGNRYRYSYALKSDLLQNKPLRELSVSVLVNSALPLKSVTCPTHTVRSQKSAHSAQVDYAVQEQSPTRDFELVCELDGKQSDVVAIPHRRGEDGYLLLQLMPPTGDGDFQREVLPDGEPLNLILLCDTSASMDSEKRKQQAELVASLLASLGEKDRFNLVATDVGTAWAFPESVAATADNSGKAQAFLSDRLSLGWTNLERAFDDVLKKSPAGANVIYIGDGIVSSGDNDPSSFVKRLARLIGEKAGEAKRSFHAVTVGNIHEAIVLKGIATSSGGSVRSVSSEQTPQKVALELLNELAQPALRDLNIEFRGLKVAGMYPERLPNLAAGTQQILVGRYLPQGADQQGEVIVTGMKGKEKVRYVAKIALKDAEEGNSFIPRLWARSHLDHLLGQGQSQATRDEIIGLSEEFHIITPYTSLLVLETDADRERFGVKRRYEMRDGERFFAEGKANANYELLQQQMKRASDWRLSLRRQMLRDLAKLGRNPQVFQRQMHELARLGAIDDYRSPISGPMGRSSGLYDSLSRTVSAGDEAPAEYAGVSDWLAYGEPGMQPDGEWGKLDRGMKDSEDRDKSSLEDLSLGVGSGEMDEKRLAERGDFDGDGEESGFLLASEKREVWKDNAFFSPRGNEPLSQSVSGALGGRGLGYGYGGGFGGGGGRYNHYYEQQPDYTSWLNTLFPVLPTATKAGPAPKDPDWPAEAIALSKSLLRLEWATKLEGLELRRVTDTFDPNWNRRAAHNSDLALYSPQAWLNRTIDLDDHCQIEFANEKERGTYSRALLLGRVRKSTKHDLAGPPAGLEYFTTSPLHQSQRQYKARVEKAGENQVRLILTNKEETYEMRYTIDTVRSVVLKLEQISEGKPSASTVYSDFVEIAGAWFASKSAIRDNEDRTIGTTTYDFKSLTKADFQKRLDEELSARPKVQFLSQPLPKLVIARQKVTDGVADFNDRMVMILHYCQLQQWKDVLEQVDAIEKAAADKPGIRWLRTILLITMRRNEEAQQRLIDEAKQLAANKSDDDVYLADFILARRHQVSAGSELQEVVDLLKPVYERIPAEWNVMPRWDNYLLVVLDSLGRKEEALALRQKMAERVPWEAYQQTNFASYLAQAGKPEAAVEWLKKELAREVKRSAWDDDALRGGLAEQYRNQARWAELLAFTTEWIAKQPTTGSGYQQHLSALVFNEQLDAANTLAEQWLAQSRVERKLTPGERVRLDAAISWAQGNGHNLSFQRMDVRWNAPLAETARFFLRHKHHFDVVERIFSYRFAETDEADRVRGEMLSQLRTDLAGLTPQQLNFFVSHALGSRLEFAEPIAGRKQMIGSEVPLEIWQKIAAQLRERWAKESDKEFKHTLGEALKSIYANRYSDSEYLPFLRERIATAAEEYKRTYRNELFEVLLSRPWDEKLETEAFELLQQLPEGTSAMERLVVQVPALHRLVDAMLANRNTAIEKQLGDSGDATKLTRPELAKKRAELRKAAMTAVADRLAALAKDAAQDDKNPLAPWLQIEESWLNVRLDRHLPQVEQLCWQLLDVPASKEDEEDEDIEPEVHQQRFLDRLLQNRALVTVMNLAARKTAAPASIERVMKYLDAAIGRGGDGAARWRGVKFGFLVALDRADDLEKVLRDWIATDVSTAPWRTMLGILLAERGKLAEAVQLFEAAQKDKLLTAAHYKMLADWYHALDRREAYERTRIDVYKQMPEYTLNQYVNQFRNRWYYPNGPLPSELDEETLFVFRALFEKSANPENYLSVLRDLYAACRDFRLLDMLPDAMLGRSPQQVYNYLNIVNSQVLYELRNEAAADEVLSRIAKLREGERTTTDLRALDLLEALLERKSSEVPNQAGPHAAKCVAALKRAFQRKWGEGELRMMARFLHDLGTLRQPTLIDEQLRELRALHKLAKEETREHLYVTYDLANVLFWSYHKQDEAIQLMQTESAAWLKVNGGKWNYEDNEVLGGYVHLYEGANRHAAGETILLAQLTATDNEQQRKWLEIRLLQLYRYALEAKTEVSLGAGAKLFDRAIDLGVKQIEASHDENHSYYLFQRLVEVFNVAHTMQISGREPKVRTFAFETLPRLLKRQHSQYRNFASTPIDVIQKTLGHKAALQYVLERLEQYPQWLDVSWDRGWNAFGGQLAYQRHMAAQAKEDLRELEPRVLKLAIAEVKRFLHTGESQASDIYHHGYQHFWTEKRMEFAKAAEEVYAEQKKSGRRVVAIASYLYSGLNLPARAIEMLLIAHQNGILDENGQVTLVNYLHSERRWAESIPLLQKLIESYPDAIHYRSMLMVAYHNTERKEQLMELLAQTDAHFHKQGRWVDSNIADLAIHCNVCGLYEQARGYFNEAIAQHQRNNGGRTLGDGTLSSWYQNLASAESALHHTKEAVDAASSAILCWGQQQSQRTDAVNQLRNVLNSAQDLDDYVKFLDKQTKETGQDSVLLRKTIGLVYKDKGKQEAAVAQLQLAVAMQPNDKETHQALIALYDALGKKDEGTRELLRQIDFDRHDLALYTRLAERFAGNEAEAERAATSIIEAAPTESENHAAYAELMQARNRWDEAIPHWKQVAELRRLEPTGLVKLAAAQIHEKQWDDARATVRQLQQTSWPARFNEVEQQTRSLQEQLPKK